MSGNLSDVQRHLKNEQKSDSFDAYYGQPFSSNTSQTYLHMCMTFKEVNQLNHIVLKIND